MGEVMIESLGVILGRVKAIDLEGAIFLLTSIMRALIMNPKNLWV